VNGIGLQLALIGSLVVVNAAFSGAEIALISLGEGQLLRLERRSAAGRALARLARDPNRFLATIQIGITLAGFLASAVAAVALAEPLVDRLGVLGAAARPVAILVVTTALTFFTLVVGELAPKRLALQRAEAWALVAARPLAGLARFASPVVWLLSRATDLTVRALGGDPRQSRPAVTDEEIRALVAVQATYTPAQRELIAGALEVADRTLRQLVVPRGQVVALPAHLDSAEALRRLAAAGHSRAPVYTADLDDADRVVSVLALVGRAGPVGDHAQPALALPESLNAVLALRDLQARRQQLALVVSEHGGVEGIITVEDLVEELVGEIYDEHDPDVAEVRHQPDGSLLVPGSFPVHDLVDLGVEIAASEDAATVAGLVVVALGRIPVAGDEVRIGDHVFGVLGVRHRAVHQVRILPTTPPARGRA
jgi:putative hemolysin